MSQEVKNIRIQQKVDTLEHWEKSNLQLLENEIAYEKETGRYKIGTGNKTWRELEYAAGGEAVDIPVKASEGENSAIFAKSTNDFNEADLPELSEIYYKPINPGYFYKKEILTDKVIDGSNSKELSFSGTELNGYGVVQGSGFRPSETVKEGDIYLFNGAYYYSDNSDEYQGYVIITGVQDSDGGNNGALWFKPISVTDFYPFPTVSGGEFRAWALTAVDVRYRFENLAFTKAKIGTIPLTTLYIYTDKWSNTRYTIYEDYTPDGKYGENGESKDIVTNDDPIYNTIKCEALFGEKKYAIATGNNAISAGQNSVAFGNNAIAIGKTSAARGSNSGAFGINGLATGINSVALNEGGKAVGYASLAVNDHCEAVNYNTIAGGYQSVASGSTSFAFGNHVITSGRCSATFGQTSEARGDYSFVAGRWNKSIDSDNVVFGMKNTASGQLSFVSGFNNTVSSNDCFISGQGNKVSGFAGFATGSNNILTGFGSAVFGSENEVHGTNGCVAFGLSNTIYGSRNMATGYDNTIEENNSNILTAGLQNQIKEGNRSTIVIGYNNKVTGTYESAIFGYSNQVTDAKMSIVSGKDNSSNFSYTAVFGEGLRASKEHQTTIGRHNKSDGSALFIIGNGKEQGAESNAFVVRQDGTVYSSGHITSDSYIHAKGQIKGNDIELTSDNSQIIMKSENGTKYKLTVSDDGTLTTEAID